MKVITIGRLKGNDVIIDNDDKVSRHHLQIVQFDDGSYHLIDFNSTNGTFVNGKQVQGEMVLDEGDFVRIGDTMLPWTTYFSPGFVSQAQEGVEEPAVTTRDHEDKGLGQDPVQQSTGSNIFAILGFIFAFIPGISIVGIVFSIIGIINAKKTGKLKGMAIAGLILSIIFTIVWVIVYVVFLGAGAAINAFDSYYY